MQSRAYLRQLDGLRAIAVFAVFVTHWVPAPYRLQISPGRLGVNLFFVLSGFLITRILLDCRRAVAGGIQSRAFSARQFYVRRFLRIFPLFYATLAVCVLLGVTVVRETLPWHVFYLSNVFFALEGEWFGRVAHLWSLAVEEQFYLVWPWFILTVRRRWLLPAVGAVALASPLLRLAAACLGWSSVSLRVLTPFCLDTLATGALLACLAERRGLGELARSRMAQWMLALGLPLVLFTTAQSAWDAAALPFLVLQSSGSALLFGWLVLRAAAGFSGGFGRVLELAPMQYAGKISYGLYVIHPFVPEMLESSYDNVGISEDSLPLALHLAFCFAVTFGLAAASWRFFEAPISRLKDRVPYARRASERPGVVPPHAEEPGEDEELAHSHAQA